jgi:hypothetical protein
VPRSAFAEEMPSLDLRPLPPRIPRLVPIIRPHGRNQMMPDRRSIEQDDRMTIFIKDGFACAPHPDSQSILRHFDAHDFGRRYDRIRHFGHLVASRVGLADEDGRVLIQMPRQMAPPPSNCSADSVEPSRQ